MTDIEQYATYTEQYVMDIGQYLTGTEQHMIETVTGQNIPGQNIPGQYIADKIYQYIRTIHTR